MNRPILACAFFALAATALVAQDQSQSSPYQGTSNPPPDDTIITSEQQAPIPKPPAGHPMQQAPAAQPAPCSRLRRPPRRVRTQARFRKPTATELTKASSASRLAPQRLTTRATAIDPDGDIVHPAPLPAGNARRRHPDSRSPSG